MHDDEWYRREYGTFDGGRGFNSTERVKRFGEVFTPRWIVEKMLDEVPDVGNVEKTVFEPCCGEGAFITCVPLLAVHPDGGFLLIRRIHAGTHAD